MENFYTTKKNLLYLFIVFAGCLISVYDNALSIVYGKSLINSEENPVGLWLLEQGGVSLLVTVKATTTILAAIIGMRIVYSKYRIAVLWVLIFQLGLFYYLTFYTTDGRMPLDYTESPMYNVAEFYGRIFGQKR